MWSAQRLAKVLLWVGVLSVSAAVLGPGEPWGAVDIGATGAAIFMLTLLAGIWLFAVRAAGVFPEEMSVTERRAWVGLLFTSIILLSFARELWYLSTLGVIPTSPNDLFLRRFVERLIPLVIAWSVISHLIARAAGGMEADERDLRMQAHANRAGEWALTLIVIGCIGVLASVPAALLAWWLAPVVLANVLIGLLIAKSLAEHLALTLQYRAARD
jgi:hypothetical protein